MLLIVVSGASTAESNHSQGLHIYLSELSKVQRPSAGKRAASAKREGPKTTMQMVPREGKYRLYNRCQDGKNAQGKSGLVFMTLTILSPGVPLTCQRSSFLLVNVN